MNNFLNDPHNLSQVEKRKVLKQLLQEKASNFQSNNLLGDIATTKGLPSNAIKYYT